MSNIDMAIYESTNFILKKFVRINSYFEPLHFLRLLTSDFFLPLFSFLLLFFDNFICSCEATDCIVKNLSLVALYALFCSLYITFLCFFMYPSSLDRGLKKHEFRQIRTNMIAVNNSFGLIFILDL